MTEKVNAFDEDSIHEGNKGLAIDHDAIAPEVEKLLASMTLEQKFNQIRGLQPQPIDGLYHSGGDEELGIPPYKMVDGPRGARTGKATAFPVAIARAATFDVDLERRVGLAVGREVAAKGGNVLLAPTINLLRHPGWGRAQETYSEDSFHTGAMGVAFISGAQNHVLTSPKHFSANNVEFTRFEMTANMAAGVLHEVYLPHFKRCVVEGAAASVMSAYNKLNEIYCGENPILLTDILRNDWGFRGFVESDWFLGTRSTAAALEAGLDIEMPGPYRFTDEKLIDAIQAGELSEEAVTSAARHALHQKFAWDIGSLDQPDESVVECEEHLAVAREAAEKSIVLMKNAGGALPLDPDGVTRIAVVGDLADWPNLGDRGSSFVDSTDVITPLRGIRERLSGTTVDHFSNDADFAPLADYDAVVLVAGLTYREEGEYIPTQQQEAEGSDLARGGDRTSLELPDHQLDLISRAAEHAKMLVVVLEGGSAILVDSWIDNADALLMAWYPGCQGGHAIARILCGDVCPSGRLPVTIPMSLDQLVPFDVESLTVDHELLPGYKYVDFHGHEPALPFGFGLSYTTFEVDKMFVERYDNGFEFCVDIINTGSVEGATVIQLYVGYEGSKVERAVRELKGFGRVSLAPGENATLAIEVTDEELMYFDESTGWQLEDCNYLFYMGFSSRELPLVQDWKIGEDGFEPV
jgi:beta-glucosidase